MKNDSCVCCFFGHREISESVKLKDILYENIEKLITKENVRIFLFGSKSQFNDLCHEIVTKLKETYPFVKRIYVRAEFPYINDSYKTYLLEKYEDTYYPEKLINAGRAVYVKRNYEMIDNSDFCVCYYTADYHPQKRKSGTAIAFSYAVKKKKTIINTAEATKKQSLYDICPHTV